MPTKTFFMVTMVIGLAGAVWAGFLPLMRDRPKRDNPFDPASQAQSLPFVAPPLPTQTATPGVVPTATPTPAAFCPGGVDSSNLATFESSVDSFSTIVAGGYTSGTVSSTTPACTGTKALCGSFVFTHGGSPVKVGYMKSIASLDWSGKALSAQTYFPAGIGASGGKLYVKVGAGYTYNAGPYVNAPVGGGWVAMTFSLSGVPGITDVREVGVDFYSPPTEPDGTFTLCLDAVNVL